MTAVKERFDEEGIEIPFPHVSLYSGSQTDAMPIRIVSGVDALKEAEMESKHE